MKKLIVIIIALISVTQVEAQQIHQLTHYLVQDLAFNPAIAGSKSNLISKLTYRKQWAGFEGSPTTTVLSAHTNLAESKAVGLGVLLYSDKTGETSRLGANFSYAYHLPLDDNGTYLSLGIGAAIFSYQIDYDALDPIDENDMVIASGKNGVFTGDLNLGTYLYNDDYFLGLSVAQLLQSEIKLEETIEENLLSRHVFLTGGYKFDVAQDFQLEPSFMMKAVKGIPTHWDLSARAIYQYQYWLGASYRTYDSIAFLLGLNLQNGLNLTYSYDITTSDINLVSNGSHEFTIGFNLNYNQESIPDF